jgi:hypothetical protein
METSLGFSRGVLRNMESMLTKNIKYGMDDIEARLDNLFHGSSASTETDSRK